MEYLYQFNRDLTAGHIPLREVYASRHAPGGTATPDVVTDLMENNQLFAAANLPIGKQIVMPEGKLTLCVPKIGDVLLGVVHYPVIRQVTFIFSNYSDEYVVAGQLVEENGVTLWKVSELPIMLWPVTDYQNVNLTVEIETNSQYNLQNGNQDVFKACYGYFHHTIHQQLPECAVYEIPLLCGSQLDVVCGIWYVH